MHILIVPDKFKGSLTSQEASEVIAGAARQVLPHATTEELLISDGGEGMVDVALAAGAVAHTTMVHGPLGHPVQAVWAMLDDTAFIELALAAGLQLLSPDPLTSLLADTTGVGQLIRAALDHGAQEIIVGVGGAASTDGGSGALRALGARLLDGRGEDIDGGGDGLLRLADIDLATLDPRLLRTRIRLATDVRNPLLGSHGAAASYGPQKGAGPDEVSRLEACLRHWSIVLERTTGRDISTTPGCGAAGGFPAALLSTTDATVEPGFDVTASLLGLPGRMASADLVIVGEGRLDRGSLSGKAPAAAAALARDAGSDVVAVAGSLDLSPDELRDAGILLAVGMTEFAPNVRESMRDAPTHLRAATVALLERYSAARLAG